MSFRKSYRANSLERAAKMACEDIEYWGKENPCSFKRIAEAQGKVRKSYFGCYTLYIDSVKRECFMFIKSGECYVIKKLSFDPLNQLNDEQIVGELRKRGHKIIIDKYLSYNNVVEKGIIKDSINDSDVQNILSESTDQQLLEAFYARGYGRLFNKFI